MINQAVVQESTTKIWNSIFIQVFIVNMLLQISNIMVNTLSAMYADYLGATATIVGLVSSLFALTAMIFKIFSAPAIDSFNRKYILIGAIFILFLSFLGYSISKTIPMLIFSRLLTGVSLAFIGPVCITIASDSLPVDKMSTGIGIFSLGSAICLAIGPAIGLELVKQVGYNQTFAIISIALLFAMAFAATMKTGYLKVNKFTFSLRSIYAHEVLIPSLILFLLNMTFSVINAFLVLFALKQGIIANIGYFFTAIAVTMIFSRPLIGKLADKYGTVRIFIPSMIFFAASFILISFSKTLPMLMLAGFISAFGYGGCQPALMAVCMRSVPKERRGAASSTSYIGLDIGNLAGPVLAGLIVGNLGYVSMWRIMIFPIFIAILVSLFFRNRINYTGKELTSLEAISQV